MRVSTPHKMLAVGVLALTLLGAMPAPAGASPQAPAVTPNTFVMNAAAVGWDGPQSLMWIQAINFYGLGIVKVMWISPTYGGVAMLTSTFDWAKGHKKFISPIKKGIAVFGKATMATTHNPNPHPALFELWILPGATPEDVQFGIAIKNGFVISQPLSADAGFALVGF